MNEPLRYTTFAAERDLLCQLAERAPWQSYLVEIGAHAGYTTTALCGVARIRGHRVLVIDPWDGTQDSAGDDRYREFTQRVAPWRAYGLPEVQRVRSVDAVWPKHVGFVFIDGDHRNPGPDLDMAWAALMSGGVMVVHDADEPGWPEVQRVVNEFPARPMHRYRYVPTVEERAQYGPSVRGLAWWVKP